MRTPPPRLAAVFQMLFLAGLAVVGTATASPADLVALTGFVANDFPAENSGVQIITDRIDDVAQPSWMTSRGWTTGFNIRDLRFNYDTATDTLQVGLNFFGIAGDADGNGDPGGSDPLLLAARGIDKAHLGGTKSIVVAFAGVNPNGSMGAPLMIAGTPESKSLASTTGLDGFTIASYLDRGRGGLSNNFGGALAGVSGFLAFDPSAAHPGYEFTIQNLSKVAGLLPQSGMYVRAFAGDPGDNLIGEDAIYWTAVGGFHPPAQPLTPPTDPPPPIDPPAAVPEPMAWLQMLIGGTGVVWLVRRTRLRAFTPLLA